MAGLSADEKGRIGTASAFIAILYMTIVAIVTWAAVRRNWSYRPLIVGIVVLILAIFAYMFVPPMSEESSK